MKRISFYLIGFVWLGLLVTSCLKGEDEGKIVANQIGLIVNDPSAGKHLMEVYDYGTIYDPRFDTELQLDSCYLINFRIDTLSSDNSPASIQRNGYRTVEMLDVLPIDRGEIRELQTDTTSLYEHEQIVVNPIARSYSYHERGRLVLFSSYNKYLEQSSKWILSYDPENRVSDTNERSLYTIYLRSTIESARKDTTDSTRTTLTISPNAFDIKAYMDKVEAEETAKGRSEFYFKIRYLSGYRILRDSLVLTWSSTDSLLFHVK